MNRKHKTKFAGRPHMPTYGLGSVLLPQQVDTLSGLSEQNRASWKYAPVFMPSDTKIQQDIYQAMRETDDDNRADVIFTSQFVPVEARSRLPRPARTFDRS